MNKHFIVYTDGGARGNPGPAGIGVVIQNQDKQTIAEYKAYIGEVTNNVAEYKALLLALDKAKDLAGEVLQINMDSELVVRQMNGQYKIKEPTLRQLTGQVFKLSKNFKNVTFHHILREFNKQADELVNQAIDEQLGINK